MPTFMNDDPEELKNLSAQNQVSSAETPNHLQESTTVKTATVPDSNNVEGIISAQVASLSEQPSLENTCEEHQFTDLNGSINVKTNTVVSASGGHSMNDEGNEIEMHIGESGVTANKMIPSNNRVDASSHVEPSMLLDITNLADPSSDVLTDSHPQPSGNTAEPSLGPQPQPQPHISNEAVVTAANDAIAAATANFIDEMNVVGSQTTNNSLGLPDLASLKQTIENSSSVAKDVSKQNAESMSIPTPVAPMNTTSTPDPMTSTVLTVNITTTPDLIGSNAASVVSQSAMKTSETPNVMPHGITVPSVTITSSVMPSPQPQALLTSQMANAEETLSSNNVVENKTCIPFQNMTNNAPKYVDTRKVMKCPKCPSTFYSKGGYYRHVKKCGTPKVAQNQRNAKYVAQQQRIQTFTKPVLHPSVIQRDKESSRVTYKCPHCPSDFFSKSGFYKHIKRCKAITSAPYTNPANTNLV